ncbi:MAG: DUF4920 domain-containing protein [Planctomycetes bacterium]|nr:DUF4920 domain-containing protein [Planctomycetota bacterium]
MTRSLRTFAFAALTCLVAVACQSTTPMQDARSDGWSHYGFDNREAGPVVALAAVEGGESNVIVRGTITDVCVKKGCWMRVRDDRGTDLFVRFQDYKFFVPMNSAGHDVVMHGTALAQMASVEELRHYAEDAGESPAEIAKITEPRERVTFFADSVYIDGTGLDDPHVQ